MKKAIYLIITSLMAFSCANEEISIRDQIELGEYDGNYVEMKENVVEIQDKEAVMEIDTGYIVLEKSDSLMASLRPGKVLVKMKSESMDDQTFWRKIVSIVDMGTEVMLETEAAGIPDVFKRINFDTRRDNSDLVVLRNGPFNYGFAFDPGVNWVPEVKGNVNSDANFDMTFDNSNSSWIALNYDESTLTASQVDIHIEDLELTIDYQASYSGQISLGEKKDNWAPPVVIPTPLASIGLSLYGNPKTFVGAKFKGSVTSPTLTLTSGAMDIDVHLENNPLFTSGSITGFNPSITQTNFWDYAGNGELVMELGLDWYISVIGPKPMHIIKAGVNTSGYGRIRMTSDKSFQISNGASDNITADAGVSAKAFLTAAMFGGKSFGPFKKAGLFFESNTFPYPLLDWQYERARTCTKITNVSYNLNLQELVFNVTCPTCSNDDLYRAWFNDVPAMNNIEGTSVFRYNQEYRITPPAPFEAADILTVQDVDQLGCYYCGEIPNLEVTSSGNCIQTFEDPRNGGQDNYCIVQIGNQTWLQSNLRYEGSSSNTIGRWKDNELTADAVVLGKYYTYEEVLGGEERNTTNGSQYTNRQIQGICPDGWHLPSIEEFNTLFNAMGGVGPASVAMKMPSSFYWPTSVLPGTSTFSAISAGEYYPSTLTGAGADAFGNFGDKASFWTSTTFRSGRRDVPRVIELSDEGITGAGGTPTKLVSIEGRGLSCRCIKD